MVTSFIQKNKYISKYIYELNISLICLIVNWDLEWYANFCNNFTVLTDSQIYKSIPKYKELA